MYHTRETKDGSLLMRNDESLRFNNARDDAHDEAADDAGDTRSSDGLTISVDGFFFGWQHFMTHGQHFLTEETADMITESSGSSDRRGLGKNSQVLSFFGKRLEHLLCRMFKRIMKDTMIPTAAPKHILGILPASDMPKTDSGSRRNISIMYKTANQRYVAVVVPRNLASFNGMFLIGFTG